MNSVTFILSFSQKILGKFLMQRKVPFQLKSDCANALFQPGTKSAYTVMYEKYCYICVSIEILLFSRSLVNSALEAKKKMAISCFLHLCNKNYVSFVDFHFQNLTFFFVNKFEMYDKTGNF